MELGKCSVIGVTIDSMGKVAFTLALTTPKCPLKNHMADEARKVLSALPSVNDVKVDFGEMSEEEKQAIFNQAKSSIPDLTPFNMIKQVIAVMSGKGGVGKSSVAAMLAVALRRQGQNVGILDADVTGPSIPKLFGLPIGGLRGNERACCLLRLPPVLKLFRPICCCRKKTCRLSGVEPIVSGTINQFWSQTIWGRLDTLLVDLPPGTSDAALTVLQSIPLNGVVLVTTPQQLAFMVVRKGVRMVRQLNIPILGVVENMSYFRCPDTGKVHNIFGPSHVDEIANLAKAPVSARLPINPQITALSDAGQVEEVHIPEMDQWRW